MKFKKGSRVEVLCKKEVPLGAWCCAEIISRKKHTYEVRYELPRETGNEVIVERVLRTAVRPFPHPEENMENWASGDVVEVLDVSSWKLAMVSNALDRDCYLVRLIGSSDEFMVHNSKIRVRKTWQDNKWVVFGKACVSSEIVKSNNFPNSTFHEAPRVEARTKLQAGNDRLTFRDNNCFQDSYMVSARTLKRASPFCSSHIEAYPSKVRAIEKGSEHQLVSGSQSILLKKVDAVASPRYNLGEKDMHTSFNKQSTGYLERENLNGASSCFFERSAACSDSDSDACSVGSCSVDSNNLSKLPRNVLAGPRQDADTHSSDAESFCHCGDEEEKYSLPLNEEAAVSIHELEEAAVSIHELELHAYSSTLVALHASGPLSWEQEALITNLRMSLHISNDEHLMEVRKLISAGKPSLLTHNQ
ncbi:hypothetical protein UlMin_035508 [Ulmus minor]